MNSCNKQPNEDDDGNGGEAPSLMGLFAPPPAGVVAAAAVSPQMSCRKRQQEERQQYKNQKTPKAVNHSMKKTLDAGLCQQLPSMPSHLIDLFTPPSQEQQQRYHQQVDTDKKDDFSLNYSQTREDSPLIISDSSRIAVPWSHNSHHNKLLSSLPTVHADEVKNEIPLAHKNNNSNARISCKRAKKNKATSERRASWIRAFLADLLKPTTWIGAFMFLLYHIVFSLTMGAAIMRPVHHYDGGSTTASSSAPIFGIMTKMSANGVMFGAVLFWWSLSDDVPALYPAVDLFCAPFLADLAVIVDETLYADENVKPQDNDAVFLASFTFLVCLGLTITGTLLMLSSVFNLANLGAFLPSPVLSGFFSAIAVLMWALAVKVDTGGISIGHILFSGDWELMLFALKHHIPSVMVGALMKVLSPMSPFLVIGCIFGVIISFYIYMAIANVGLQEMVEAGWFWSKDQLINKKMKAAGGGGFDAWEPPAPAGWINYMVQGKVHWGAVQAGLSSAIALALLYMIRCSLHGAALRKNISIMTRYVKADCNAADQADSEANNACEQTTNNNTDGAAPGPLGMLQHPPRLQRQMSETVDLSAALMSLSIGKIGDIKRDDETTNGNKVIAVQSQPTKHTLTEILAQYAISQLVCALVGGFAIVPSIGPSATMYTLGAESVAPQFLSVAFLAIFYFTNFQLVTLIPKPAFSSVLVLACIDILHGWFFKSFRKTQSKVEWLVNPFIVLTASFVGLLSSVFLGIALSTFFFVAAFYQSGVVKYVANGITIRSTIERPTRTTRWLDTNGDLIQILVLQSYLFFGNATSVLNYARSMFEETEDEKDRRDAFELPPLPKVVVLDFSLVTGMDGSAVDVMADLLSTCSEHNCKLFVSGTSVPIRKTLRLGGMQPDTSIKDRSKRKLRFFPDIDSAVGKAEDLIIQQVYEHGSEYLQGSQQTMEKLTGFARCLAHIDEQHFTAVEKELVELGKYTKLVILRPGEILYEDHNFHLDRGLFFIEEGTLRIERDASATRSLTHAGPAPVSALNRFGSLNALRARSATIARQSAQLKAAAENKGGAGMQTTFRLARIGPGWVIGDQEALLGVGLVSSTGTTIAVDECRLHYISYDKLDRVEKENPVLILQLYKLLSKLHALRSEVTIAQLATMHSIMSAPGHNRSLIVTTKNPFMRYC